MAMVSVLTELDSRHLGAVTLAVAGLEDARVPAVPRGEPRPDLLKELVRRFALLDMATGVPARALVTSFSTNGRNSFAFASVVSMDSASMSEVARLRISASFCSLVRRS